MITEPEDFVKERHIIQLRNLASNLIHLDRTFCVYQLAALAPGTPAVIVGSGPSLDDHIDDLKAMQHRVWILATNSALRPLLQQGIAVDFTVGVEFRDPEATLADLPTGTLPRAVLLVSCHPGFFKPPWTSILVGYHAEFPAARCLFGEQLDPPVLCGGNVSTLALTTAFILGSRHIALMGHDLAFRDKKKYAAQSPGITRDQDHQSLLVPAIEGGQCCTSPAFAACIHLLSNQITAFHRAGLHCVDLKSRGARIPGLKPTNPRSWIASLHDAPPPPRHFDTPFVPLRLEVPRIQRSISQLKALIRQLNKGSPHHLSENQNQLLNALCHPRHGTDSEDPHTLNQDLSAFLHALESNLAEISP